MWSIKVTREHIEEDLVNESGVWEAIRIDAFERIGKLVIPAPRHTDSTCIVVLHCLAGIIAAGILTGVRAGD